MIQPPAPIPEPVDCIVIGSGAAGVAAITWLVELGVAPLWLSTTGRVGGMLERVHNPIANHPPGHFDNGLELARALDAHLERAALPRPRAAHVERIEARAEGFVASCTGGERSIVARTVLVATGTRYRTLGVPGEAEGLGRYVSQSAMRDAERVAGRTVAVVGGGDAAFENALRLAHHGCRVHLLARNGRFAARDSFVAAVRDIPAITIWPTPTRIERIVPTDDGGCVLELDAAGAPEQLAIACLFVRIGVDAVIPAIVPAPALDRGYLVVDGRQQSSVPGLFAAGDAVAAPLHSVATAMGSAAAAARAIAEHLGLA